MADAELEGFKALNLGEVAASYGYELDKRESSRASLVMRHPDGDKIVVATGADGHGIFFSVRTDASGSVIDFVMHREGGNLGYARKALRNYAPAPSFPTAQGLTVSIPKPRAIPHDRAALAVQWQRFALYAGDYLAGRGLNAATLDAAGGRLRTDKYGNALFRHDDRDGVSGWEVKNRGFTGFSAGGIKALFGVRVGIAPGAEPPRVVIAESAIDVLSYQQLHPLPALLLSFGGGMSPEQHELMRDVLTKYPRAWIITATDNDAQGEEYAATIAAIRPDAQRARPTLQDWNDDLKAMQQPAQPGVGSTSPPVIRGHDPL